MLGSVVFLAGQIDVNRPSGEPDRVGAQVAADGCAQRLPGADVEQAEMGGAFDAALDDLALREQRRLMGADIRRGEKFAIDAVERDLHAAMLDAEQVGGVDIGGISDTDPAHGSPNVSDLLRQHKTNALHDQQVRAIMRTETTRSIAFALDSRMDDFDIKLLRALQDDGRLTNNELADKVGLSASQCSRRRAALEASGVIASYHAMLSAEALGLDVLVFVQVTLATHSPENAQRFLRLVEGLDEVQEAYSLTGESDYLVKLSVPTLRDLSRLLADVFLAHPSVAHVRSAIVLDRLKQTSRLSLAHVRAMGQPGR